MIEFILALIFIEKVDEVMLPSNVGMMHDRIEHETVRNKHNKVHQAHRKNQYRRLTFMKSS